MRRGKSRAGARRVKDDIIVHELYVVAVDWADQERMRVFFPMDEACIIESSDASCTIHVRGVVFTPPTSSGFLLPHFPLTVTVQLESDLPEAVMSRAGARMELLRADSSWQGVPLAEKCREGSCVVLRGILIPDAPGVYEYRVLLEVGSQRFDVARGEVRVAEPRAEEAWTQGPLIADLERGLLLGNAAAAANPRILAARGVGAVLNAAAERDPSPALLGTGIEYAHFPFTDFSNNRMDEARLREAVWWIHRQIGNGRSVLVHCHAGIGRSGSLVVAYLLLFRCPASTYDEVVGRVNERLIPLRHWIYPHLGIPESVQRLREGPATPGVLSPGYSREPMGKVLGVALHSLVTGRDDFRTESGVGAGHEREVPRGEPLILRVQVRHEGSPPQGVHAYTNLNLDAPAFERILMAPVAGTDGIYKAELLPSREGESYWLTAYATLRRYDHDAKVVWVGGDIRLRVTGSPVA